LKCTGEGWRQSVQLSENLRSITKCQGGKEHPTYSKMKDDELYWLHLL